MDRPRTKDQALRAIGVDARSTRRAIAPYVDFEDVGSGRRLLSRCETPTDVLIGVSGSTVVSTEGQCLALHGPLVVDGWARDDQSRSFVDVTTSSSLSLLRINWQFRSVVYEAVPALSELSAATASYVLGRGEPAQLSA